MQQETRNQKISKIAAKTAIRIFIIILFFGLLPFIAGNQEWDQRIAGAHLIIPSKWTLIAPAILFLGFLTLTIICLKTKYRMPDVNWLLVFNTLILLIYLGMLYSRIFKVLLP
ncbi:MAG TPA: hypothetical protein VJ720_13890 [Chitinophaga sp.]|uniref:DUF1648 domain-containing protein n=1 Tax=Chitinophaga tropicalis TaxID=2683588 RepID=A0A7K1TYK9_9BACT|nr:hypothetical protein [Chitinophaga tropicalis]MVT07146.1 hypothetical protein [Chitinophaga tropicalis]HJT75119.1 hypothetical protein [Chitinophaga sp.]